ncbi:MAG: GreA/GreB family elongation factor [Simkaniaceae bacterium]|nr:GreA/GreB family elongation factor [Simkaniaceae bacterium]
MNYLNQFQKHISNQDFPAFLNLWEEYCMGDEVDGEELKQVLLFIKNTPLASPFGRHVENAFVLWEMIKNSPIADVIFGLIYDLQTVNSEELAERAIAYLLEKYGSADHFQEKLRLVGLREKKQFQGAINDFELLNHMRPGNFVFHTGGWGVGEIMEVSHLREQLSIEFDYVPGRKDLSFKNAFNNLVPISNDHFLALRFGNPDALELRAKTSPMEVIHILLRDLGPKTAGEIKDELEELVIPEKDWTKWWQTTRSKIKKDTLIENPPNLKEPFKLRKSALTHEERFQKLFEKKPNAATLIQMVYSFLRDFPKILKNKEFKEFLLEKLTKALSFEEITDAEELQIHFFLEDINPDEEFKTASELISLLTNLEEVIQNIEVVSFKKRTFVTARKTLPNWTQLFLNLLLKVDQNPLRDYLLKELLSDKKEEEVIQKLEELLAHPEKHPAAFIWYFQKIMHKTNLPFSDHKGKNLFFESFLILLNHLEQKTTCRDLVKKMHLILEENHFSNVRKIMQKADIKEVREFLLLATKCHSISDHDIKILHSLAEVAHPSLGSIAKKYQNINEKEESTIWTTEEGYHKLKERIKHIGTVETVENAKEIEIARSHGDLRENSEFKFALEKRDRLQSELKLLSDQFNQARILVKEEVNTNEVSVGVIVDFKNKSGEITSYTLLGPWDADPENQILSFQSQLATSMIHKKIGDKINIQGQEHTISAIRNYFS